MNIAFLNLCHCDPKLVARAANKLTKHPQFDMYIHVDGKTSILPFKRQLKNNHQVYFIEQRKKVYWGGFHAIEATIELLRAALQSNKKYEYFVLLQNLDYPIKSNGEIARFFEENPEAEYIRGCKIGRTSDWHYKKKYKLYYKRDDDFYIQKHSKAAKLLHSGILGLKSISTIGFNGVIKEDKKYVLYYGAAQWAVTRSCAQYFVSFYETHPKFNRRMEHVQFPDEEYFHTIVHNSEFKSHCVKQDEPPQRWLVNWRNIHYFEFPKEVTVFTKDDFAKLMQQDSLFCRKVKSGISDQLLDQIDAATKDEGRERTWK